jgi:hypothetical protein
MKQWTVVFDRFRGQIGAVCLPLLMLSAFILLSAGRLHAQALGGINGTVTDSTGASIPGASITATDPATGVSAHAVTSSVGTYTITALNPGHYNVTASKTESRPA